MYKYIVTITTKTEEGINLKNEYICDTWAQVGEYLPKDPPNKYIKIKIKPLTDW